MYKIKIERDSSYAGYYDTFTVEPDETSVLITHEAEGFMNKVSGKIEKKRGKKRK